MDCIIKERRIKGQRVTDQDKRIATLTGRGPLKAQKSVRYENLETEESYLCLAGGFAWPGLKSGFAVVLAVQQLEGKNHIFKVLAEVEEKNMQNLLDRSFDLFLRYGKNCAVIPWQWYGDPESGFKEFLRRFNEQLRKEEHDHGFYLTHPPYFKEPNRFALYCRTIYSLLQGAEKRLFFGPCKSLPSYLNQLNDEGIQKGTPEDHPAVAALGYVLSALHQYEPWCREVEVLNKDRESYADYAVREQAQAFKDLGLEGYDFGEQDQFDDDALTGTIQEE
jgi:hypothetical protein